MTEHRARLAALGVLGLGMVLPGVSAAVEVDGSVIAAVVYSDNIALSPKGQEEDDFVGQLVPGIRITGAGVRYELWLDYQLQLFYYLDAEDSTGVYSNGSTGLDLALIQDRLFLDSRAAIDQVVVDPEGAVSSTNLPINTNRTDAMTLETTPRWEQDIFGADLVASYKIGSITYDDEFTQDVDYRYTDAEFNTPERERGLSASARYEHRLYDYEFTEELKRALAEGTVYWNLGGGWAPFVSGGQESDYRDRTSAALTEGIWSAGLRRDTPKTRFLASAGERSFGSTWEFLLERQYGSDTGDIIRLSYEEEPRTNEDISLVEPVPEDPLGPIEPPPVTPIGIDTIFVQKRGEILAAQTLTRNRFTVLGFWEEDEDSVRADSTEPTNTKQVGGTFTWEYDVGSRTQLRTHFLFTDRRFDATATKPKDQDHLFWIRVGLTYQLGQNTSTYFWISHEEQQGSSDPNREYKENQIGVSLSRAVF